MVKLLDINLKSLKKRYRNGCDLVEKEIGVVVVTYNRLEKLKLNLACLKNLKVKDGYSYRFVIVNNASTDGTKQFLEAFSEDDRFEILNLETNTGGSGGFYQGIKWCCDHDSFAIWGMDDDAYPEEASLYNLLDCAENIGFDNCLQSNSYALPCDTAYKEINSLIFVGFFLTCEMIQKIGNVRGDFFIMHDDTEYAKRLQRFGLKTFFVKESRISHTSQCANYYENKSPFTRLRLMKLPDWKMYYLVRNHFLTCKAYNNEKLFYSIFVKFVLWYLKTLYFCPKQTKILRLALKDGLKGISGRNDDVTIIS